MADRPCDTCVEGGEGGVLTQVPGQVRKVFACGKALHWKDIHLESREAKWQIPR